MFSTLSKYKIVTCCWGMFFKGLFRHKELLFKGLSLKNIQPTRIIRDTVHYNTRPIAINSSFKGQHLALKYACRYNYWFVLYCIVHKFNLLTKSVMSYYYTGWLPAWYDDSKAHKTDAFYRHQLISLHPQLRWSTLYLNGRQTNLGYLRVHTTY